VCIIVGHNLIIFRKYNVALPSSAAVERLFSIGGMIGSAKRNRLRPALFESLLLQRVNSAGLASLEAIDQS
jgi:hypothetical protein